MKVEIRPFEPRDEQAVVALWGECGLIVPWNDPGKDIRRKLQIQREMFLVATKEGRVVGSVMGGYDGHRGWVNYLAVHPDQRRGGLGRRLMDVLESRLRELGCPKINLQVRTGNQDVIEFYKNVGFKLDDVVSMGKRLEADD